MKKFLFILIALVTLNVSAEVKYEQKGNLLVQVNTGRSKGEPTKTKYQTQDAKGNVFDVYMSPSGSCFYFTGKTNKNGTPQRRYLGPEMSAKIAKEYGVEYTPRSTKKQTKD